MDLAWSSSNKLIFLQAFQKQVQRRSGVCGLNVGAVIWCFPGQCPCVAVVVCGLRVDSVPRINWRLGKNTLIKVCSLNAEEKLYLGKGYIITFSPPLLLLIVLLWRPLSCAQATLMCIFTHLFAAGRRGDWNEWICWFTKTVGRHQLIGFETQWLVNIVFLRLNWLRQQAVLGLSMQMGAPCLVLL